MVVGQRVNSIGTWQTAMELMGVVGVIVNCVLIGQSIEITNSQFPKSKQINKAQILAISNFGNGGHFLPERWDTILPASMHTFVLKFIPL